MKCSIPLSLVALAGLMVGCQDASDDGGTAAADAAVDSTVLADEGVDATPAERRRAILESWESVGYGFDTWDSIQGGYDYQRLRIGPDGAFVLGRGYGFCPRTYERGTLRPETVAAIDQAIRELDEQIYPLIEIDLGSTAPFDDDELLVLWSKGKTYLWFVERASALQTVLASAAQEALNGANTPAPPVRVSIIANESDPTPEGEDLSVYPSVPWTVEELRLGRAVPGGRSFMVPDEYFSEVWAICEAGRTLGPRACGWFFFAEQDGVRYCISCVVEPPLP